ncbi:hypothetical protein C4565_01740 [Candidatus Parcubacteria bacterium]|jgi:hypothetical protein|nr:MAG: hypothetical protein C4565_01740 [Candidatus Parcubacteria bacterium]
MDQDELIDFIIYAKKRGYANISEATEVIKYEKSGAIKIIIRRGDWEYTDKYVGSKSFIGHEVVYYKGKPVWSMSYHGRVQTDDETTKQHLTAFLKNALAQVDKDSIFRGPRIYMESDFTYINTFHGSLEFFSGEEMISQKPNTGLLYELRYNGGSIR